MLNEQLNELINLQQVRTENLKLGQIFKIEFWMVGQ